MDDIQADIIVATTEVSPTAVWEKGDGGSRFEWRRYRENKKIKKNKEEERKKDR